ncbi:4'-phosphopantetheinyl transferase family protein [Gemmatimonadota bacterium]
MNWLSAEETARAEQVGTGLLGRRLVARQGVLRGLLGRALGQSPGDVRLLYGEEGKPSVEAEPALFFSLSHSGPVALVALAWHRRVGVDVEERRVREDLEGLAGRVFSPDETEALTALPTTARREAFYRGWTRKEALAKALGKGIASSFHRFSVSLEPAESSSLAHLDLPGESALSWTLLDLEPAPGYKGALAMENAGELAPTLWSLPLPPEPGVTIFDAWRD